MTTSTLKEYAITSEDLLYPQAFNPLKSPPAKLWIRGEMPKPNTPLVGIVGTRDASESSKRMAYEFAKRLSQEGIWIVSGLARGIDTAAHKGSLGKTIGIMGSGLNHIYPTENRSLSEQMTLMTAYSPDTKPSTWNFPQRNKLVAALSDVLIIIEAPEKSGSLITAKDALQLGKKCFAIPGPIDKEHFKGSNRLIKEGKATLCEGTDEIFAFLKRGAPAITPEITVSKNAHPKELKILSLLQKEDLSFDQLLLLTGFTASVLNVHLMGLCLNKAIREYSGRIYGKITHHR